MKAILRSGFLALAIMALAVRANAGPFEDALAAAQRGNINGQVNAGRAYYDGDGVRRNYKQAMKWWRRAAEQGDPTAQTNLAVMYALGRGVRIDYVQANMWFSLAAAQGDKTARTGRYVTPAMTVLIRGDAALANHKCPNMTPPHPCVSP